MGNDLFVSPKLGPAMRFLAQAVKPGAKTRLLPRNALEDAVRVIEGRLKGQDANGAVKQAMGLVGAFPAINPADKEIYLRALSSALQKVPQDIGAKVILRYCQTNRFAPTMADIVSLCDDELSEYRRCLRLAQLQLKEHARRDGAENDGMVNPDKLAELSKTLKKVGKGDGA